MARTGVARPREIRAFERSYGLGFRHRYRGRGN